MAYLNPPMNRRFGQPEGNKPSPRPKGIPNRATIARKVLEMVGQPPEAILKYFQQYYPKFLEKKDIKWTNEFLGYMRLMLNALIKGDTRAFELILDSAYGKQGGDIVLNKTEIETTIVNMTAMQRDERIKELESKLKKVLKKEQSLITNKAKKGGG